MSLARIPIVLRAVFLTFVIFTAGGTLQAETPSWQTLEGCRLLKDETRDGDSFHVKHQGNEYIFRLYYVDTPEKKEMSLTKRTTEQAKYWKIYKKDLYLLAEEASTFTSKELSKSFIVVTRWEDAKGNSQLPRFYAVIRTADQKDLASLLVENGLARVYGMPVESPDGTSGKKVVEDLEKRELEAKAQKRGAWGFPAKGTPAVSPKQ